MKLLIVGGAGYIGAHMALLAAEQGHQVVVLDDLSSGRRGAVVSGSLIVGNSGDAATLNRLFADHRFDGVMHFASFIQVGESVREPGKYYRNNVCHTLELLDAMVRHGVKQLVFSSTAAIFGQPDYTPIDEAHPKQPINPYGRSKWMVEQILEDYERAYGLKSCCLRYFNASGADAEGRIGENHDPETHLIPLLLQVASGRRDSAELFGSDYDTPDGTCIRDYIHVTDLCSAHLLGLDELAAGAASTRYNLGNGAGYSVRQVLETVRHVTGRAVPVRECPRRAGDPARLVADSGLAQRRLGWKPRYGDLQTIVAHAWAWEKKSAGIS